MKNLTKEQQNLLISVYEIGFNDGNAGLKPYNNFVTNESKIEYLDAILNPETEECPIELVDSVS